MTWAVLTPEEKKVIRARQHANKSRREKHRLERVAAKEQRDVRSKTLGPGDWVKFRPAHCPVDYADKLALIVDWADDGFNSSRAPRNLKVMFSIEPHLNEDEPILYQGKLQEVLPMTEMQVIAEASK